MRKLLPFLTWLPAYRRQDLPGDLMAGVIVTIMLIPQSLAYAMLAGLPPEYGLYASILPLFVYGLLGTSRTLSVGPVAVVALMTASALTPFAAPGSEQYVQLALLLALMTGVIQLVLGLVRAGFVASLLSHPVVAGFITSSSILIIISQLKHILGVSAASGHLPYEAVLNLWGALGETSVATLVAGLSSIALLFAMRGPLRALLTRVGLSKSTAQLIARTGPAVLVVAGMAAVGLFGADTRLGIAVVGEFPSGLPGLTLPALDVPVLQALLPAALMIVLVGYVESVSVGRALGARRRQVIDPDQELVALGASNIAAGFTGGMPVTGGFSRSVVNYDAGAQTGLASMITAVLIGLVTLFVAKWFSVLPQVVLAATVIVAVSSLLNFREVGRLWRYSKGDGALMALTMLAVLGAGVEIGIAVGVVASLMLYLWRASRPHIAVLGRVGDSEHFRNIRRHTVTTYPGLLIVRIDENLFFANTRFLEDRLLSLVAADKDVKHLVLVCSAISLIDASALESLENFIRKLRELGITVHLTDVKGPVMDRLQLIDIEKHLQPGRIFLSTHEAVVALTQP